MLASQHQVLLCESGCFVKSCVPYEHGYLTEENGGGEYIQWDPCHLLAGMIQVYLTSMARKDLWRSI